MEDRSALLRIGQLAARTGVSPERLRAWETRYRLLEPDRSTGNFRLYSREDEWRVRLMQRHLARGFAAAEAAELARNGIVSPSPTRLATCVPRVVVKHSSGLLQRAFDQYDEGAAERALDELFRSFTIEAVLRDVVPSLLRAIGEAWAGGEATPGQEHFASTLIHARLILLARGWGSGSGPRALLACPSGERHTLGLTVFGIALSRRGWRITYLGEDTPIDSITHAVRSTDPALVMLSGAQTQWFERVAGGLARLAREHRVALAGAGASAALAARVGAEHIVSDPVSAAAELALSTQRPELTKTRPAEAGRI
jgi:DNA-binding transcriptional MerR regulator/methylmalonyl-CoA mutase cobalamin-binding subunit